jgi:hypothetical protein
LGYVLQLGNTIQVSKCIENQKSNFQFIKESVTALSIQGGNNMIVSFEFPVSCKLPLEDGIAFVSKYPFGSIRADIYTSIIKEGDSAPDSFLYQLDENQSVAVVRYSPNEIQGDKRDILSESFTISLNFLNKIIDGIKCAYGFSYIPNIYIHDLPTAINASIDDEDLLYTFYHQKIKIHSEFRIIDPSEVGRFLSTWDNMPEMAIVDRFLESAKTYLHREQHTNAILDLQTSFELFIRNVQRVILVKKDASVEKLRRMGNLGFMNVIKDHLDKTFRGKLDINIEGPMMDWHVNLYSLRNEIIHHGRLFITGNEAYLAYDSYTNARDYISELLVEFSYTTPDRIMRPTDFNKNYKIDDFRADSEVIERLKELGFLPKDQEIKFVK